LHSSELVEIKLSRAKLVILSACETAFERFNKSEGAIGAARSFLAMGAPLVAAGNWKIDSEASKDLMILFHRNRREKSFSSAESLRQAQIEMLRRTENNQPYFWAAFDISGGFTDY
jgi:CHAT domain-containing protein